MPTTAVQIINKALSHLGHTIFIDSRDDEGHEVAVSDVHYDDAVAVVLEDFWWGFARRFITLGLVTDFTALTTPQKWYYAYRYPIDTVTIRGIITTSGELETNPSTWEVGSDDTGRLIYTNQEECVVEVTKLITDPTLYTAMFAEAVSWYLAFQMAAGITKDKSIVGNMLTMYTRILQTAQAKDASESHYNPQLQESEAIRARA